MHWINALAMIIMIGSGWKIYNDEVLFGWLHFPDWITIGGEAQGALQWHFFAMWILAVNGLCYLAYGIASGRFRRKLFPIRPREVVSNIRDALAVPALARRHHPLQRGAEAAVCRDHPRDHSPGPVRFGDLEADAVLRACRAVRRLPEGRLVHFLGMAAIVVFVVIHVALALLVPKTLGAMITGGPRGRTRRRLSRTNDRIPPEPAR